ncbi:ABC transporter substrate-binding protein [Paenibacillus cymbidii]|uniref:ABC transporter substrate-binding protein n=1 Tax=Paenibacillus cymbidii TaxID=1639034 RepID=UPI0014367D57|nr:extracellular solute-binding protein [Paenibacillus cymbidii]
MNKKGIGSALVASMMVAGILAACSGKENGENGASPKTSSSASPSAAASASASPKPSDAGSGGNADVKGTITWATHRTDLVDNGTFDAYVAKFKAKYPGVTNVKIEGLKDYGQTIKVRLAGNEAPDVFSPVDTVQENYASLYAPLDDLGLKGKIILEQNGTYNNHLYYVTTGGVTGGLIYNKAAFAKAGLSGPPKTLDELYAAAAKLKAAGITPMATDFKDAWTLGYYFDAVSYYAGSDNYHNYIFNTANPFTSDGPFGKGFGILKKMIDNKWVEPDIYSTDWENSIKEIATGKAGMYYIGQWLLPQMASTGGGNPKDFGFVPFPYDNSGTYKALIASDYSIAVSAKSKNLPTAKAWLKFIIEESAYADDAGLLPALKDRASGIPQLTEFNSWKPTYVTSGAQLQPSIEIEQKMQFDPTKMLQEAVVAKDMQTVFDKYNKLYADTKKAAGK